MAKFTLALDIYGTLVDPLEMDEHLEEFAGQEKASEASALWRQKQLEYTFRRGLMGLYEDFGIVTDQALQFTSDTFGLGLDGEQRAGLISDYQNLRAFPDVAPGLDSFRAAGFGVVAFSNGVEATTRKLLKNAGILNLLDDVVSVDDIKTFKPAPKVYEYLCSRVRLPAEEICLVSSNLFDVIGAKHYGLNAAWLKRSSAAVLDPWEINPDFIARDLQHLASDLTSTTGSTPQ